MKRFLSLAIAVSMILSLFPGNMSKAYGAYSPNITSVASLRLDGTMASPAKGPVDQYTDIKITGSGFVTYDTNGNVVSSVSAVYIDSPIDSNKLTILSANENTIYAKVPPASKIGLSPDTPYTIIVQRSDGQSAAIFNGFTYINNPYISKVALDNFITLVKDSNGNIISRTTKSYIRMEGSYLNDIGLAQINGETASVVSQSGSVLITTIPQNINIDPTTLYTVNVTNIYRGRSNTVQTNIYAVNQDITGLSQYTVIVGDTITIYGHGFSTLGSGFKVYVGANLVNSSDVNIVSDTEMTVKVPAPKDTTLEYQNIDIVAADGSTATLVDALKIIPTPAVITIDNITPNAGSVSGGTKVIIVGQNLREDLIVKFGGVVAKSVQSITLPGLTANQRAIQVTTPPYSKSGPVDVSLVDPITGYTVTKQNGFFYLAVEDTMVVVDMNPDHGYENGNTDVTLWGFNFQRSDDPSIYTANSDNTEITYTNTNYTYKDPATGNLVEGSRERKLYVTFGGNKAQIKSIFNPGTGQQTLNVLSPSVTLNPPGQDMPVDVVVTVETTIKDANGNVVMRYSEQSSPPTKFTYNPLPSNPQILSISPSSGSHAGGDTVIIQGFDIRPGVKVYFGDKLATVKDLTTGGDNKSVLTVISPPSTALGYVDVKVVNKDADANRGFAIYSKGYYYYTAPSISNIFTNFGSKYGGNFITITGSDFYVGQTVIDGVYMPKYPDVRIGNIQLKVISVEDKDGNIIDGKKLNIGTKIKAIVPETQVPYTVGWQDVTIQNYDGISGTVGGSVTLQNAFEIKDTQKNPTITSVDPSKGPTKGGTPIKIMGSNFEKGSIVTIDGVQATVTKVLSGNTEIDATTPPGTLGKKIVQVVNPSDGGTATLVDGFEYLLIETKPQITKVVPNYGGKGTLIYIFGSDFSLKAGDSEGAKAYIGDTVLENVYVINDTTITGIIPDMRYSGLYDIKVVNPDTAQAVAPEKFHFLVPESSPIITSVYPNFGTVKGGTSILIEGSDFRRGAEVFIGGNKATNVTVSSDGKTITATTPPGVPGKTYVTVVNYDGGNYTYGLHEGESGFTYVVPNSQPVITKIEPNSGSTYGGQEVTIYGQDFRISKDENGNILKDENGNPIGPEVYFGNVKAEKVTYIDYGTLKVITPPNVPGKVRVTVVNYDAGLGYIDNGYTYIQSKPQIKEVIPPKFDKAGGTYSIIIGSDFAVPVYDNDKLVVPGSSVYIDGTKVHDVKVVDSTMIKFTAPPVDKIGMKELKVVNPDGGTAVFKIEYVSPNSHPLITSITPNKGSINGGTYVTIKGQDFREKVKVYFDAYEAKVVANTSDTITVITPAADPQKDLDRLADVTVFNIDDGGSYTLKEAFMYIATESNPKITSITPNTGSTKGGETVTITGNDFRQGARVFFGDAEAYNVIVKSYNTIVVTTPGHAEGKVDVIVRNPDYANAVLPQGFTYVQTVPDNPVGFWAESIAGNDHTLYLHWSEAKGAKYYEIYGKIANSADYKFIASTDKLEYYVTNLLPNTTYSFAMRAVNDLGPSDFVYTYATTDTSSNSKYDTSVTGVKNDTTYATANGSLVITLGDDILNTTTYKIDLTGNQYKNISKWVINIPSKYKNRTFTTIWVIMPGFNIKFTLNSLYLSGDYDRITINKLSDKTYDEISRNMPKGYKILSDIYDMTYEKIDGDKTSSYPYFYNKVNVALNVDKNRLGNKNISFSKLMYITAYMSSVPATGLSINNNGISNMMVDSASNNVLGDISYPGRLAVIY
ncbi:IPT/TIG domain/Fibronectin type III domain containing protein [Thermoanaerobacter thermohydrosulfuricus WC1]|uniref:IPT/TIG domain/Fibronectin type III domain containing protein n=1 Tax=Thermoanaerobacter thermohydrosulfuricus WC1 TaxID=1198630 RepID=M8DSE7_THETY|nr:IPT/TIG domain-containing protein [Thermoanaerobacter thermohydrosulfuricus]EMT39416.1 IPT/TIG domain/Fibronectin type III domain containing protein [Thermoanaerobacter thermohydrosulfuricus WC1]